MRVVSLAGPKGSGKNEIAKMATRLLFERHIVAREVAFADPIRAMADALGLPWKATRADKDRPCDDLHGATGRGMLNALGEAVRGVDPDYFATHMWQRLDDLARTDPDGVLFVTDTRRANELTALERWASQPGRHLARLWVSRPGHDADEVIEASVRARCVEVSNAGSIADLEIKAAAIASWLSGGAS